MLEPCDAKVSCTVLRGLGDRKVARLLGSLHASGSSTVCRLYVHVDYFRMATTRQVTCRFCSSE